MKNKLLIWRRDYQHREKKRVNARNMVATYFKRGKIQKVECCCCGKKENLEFHHPNYNKPFNVMVLCKKCHLELHRALKIIAKKGGEENSRYERTRKFFE